MNLSRVSRGARDMRAHLHSVSTPTPPPRAAADASINLVSPTAVKAHGSLTHDRQSEILRMEARRGLSMRQLFRPLQVRRLRMLMIIPLMREWVAHAGSRMAHPMNLWLTLMMIIPLLISSFRGRRWSGERGGGRSTGSPAEVPSEGGPLSPSARGT